MLNSFLVHASRLTPHAGSRQLECSCRAFLLFHLFLSQPTTQLFPSPVASLRPCILVFLCSCVLAFLRPLGSGLVKVPPIPPSNMVSTHLHRPEVWAPQVSKSNALNALPQKLLLPPRRTRNSCLHILDSRGPLQRQIYCPCRSHPHDLDSSYHSG